MMRRFMKNGGKTIEWSGRGGFDGICLERWRQIRHRIRKTKPLVTIAIGLISKPKGRPPHMIFASDSQTTYGAAKSLDAQKISIVNFADAQVLVAQAGMAELSDKAIEIMRKKAKDVPLENSETVAKITVESVREIRNHFYELNKGCVSSDEGWKRFFLEQNYFQLLVGYYFDRKPFMFTVDIDMCFAIPVNHPYKAIGIGRDYAETLVREYLQVDPDFEYAQIIAAAVVEKTIDNIDGCGRPTWLGVAYPQQEEVLEQYKILEESARRGNYSHDFPLFKSVAILQTQQEIKWITVALQEQENQFTAQRKEMILSILKKALDKRQEWAKRIQDESKAQIPTAQN
jgi:20S proteasome alpha/beta subunit